MRTNESSNTTAEIRILKEVFAAINRNDLPACLEYFDPQVERIEPEGYATAGLHRGREKVQANVSAGRGTWAEGSCDPERFLVAGDKVIVFLHARVRLKDKIDWIDGRFADVFTFRHGTIIQWRTFWENQEALDWVRVKDPSFFSA
jgi:uncharacterized protein